MPRFAAKIIWELEGDIYYFCVQRGYTSTKGAQP